MILHLLFHLRHWLAEHVGIGTDKTAIYWYSFWSGFGSDIGEATLIGGAIVLIRNHNCEVHGCKHVGRLYEYDMDGVKHRVCKRHHPQLGKDHKLHHHHLLAHHEKRL